MEGVELCKENVNAEWIFLSGLRKFHKEPIILIPIKETTKTGSLILRNSKIAIIGRVSIHSDQINLILFG